MSFPVFPPSPSPFTSFTFFTLSFITFSTSVSFFFFFLTSSLWLHISFIPSILPLFFPLPSSHHLFALLYFFLLLQSLPSISLVCPLLLPPYCKKKKVSFFFFKFYFPCLTLVTDNILVLLAIYNFYMSQEKHVIEIF